MNNDGLPDIALTALSGETFPLFRNNGGGQFADVSYNSRMGPLSRAYSGWGIGLFDFDNDGLKDIFTANSHVNDRVDVFEATEYLQRTACSEILDEDSSRMSRGWQVRALCSPCARIEDAHSPISTGTAGST